MPTDRLWLNADFYAIIRSRAVKKINRKKIGVGYKPNSVSRHAGHDHLSWTPVTRHLQRSTRKLRTGSPQTFPYLILLLVGFTLPSMSPWKRWALTSPFHPYPVMRGGMFSVALSSGHPEFALRTTMPCEVRTFLWPALSEPAIMHPLQIE